ncbi:MAG TPA: hypothetical protein VN761_01885 [Candidatus Polarisedimenticolia bacterium]|nr:hypothetical protein [Candidatus Polarisedimenticolia bacterium]
MGRHISIDLREGYWPHFAPEFFARYGDDSLFVRAVADCLTARHVNILIKAQRISPNTQPRRRGLPSAKESLDALFSKMRSDGAVDDVLHVLRESTGVKSPCVLEGEVDSLYGPGTFDRWLNHFERREFATAASLLHRTF